MYQPMPSGPYTSVSTVTPRPAQTFDPFSITEKAKGCGDDCRGNFTHEFLEQVVTKAFPGKEVERQTIFLQANDDIFKKLREDECRTGTPTGLYADSGKVLCLG